MYAPAEQPRPRMLLAEDDDEIREILASIFTADGFDVLCARNGYELVDLLEQSRDSGTLPYIILTDHRMPGFTGSEVAEALRENAWPVPIIIMTAYGRDLADQPDTPVADLIFEKPFDADDLRTAVLYCIEERRGRRPAGDPVG